MTSIWKNSRVPEDRNTIFAAAATGGCCYFVRRKIIRGFFPFLVYNRVENGKGGGGMNEQEIRALLLSRDERGMQELLRHYGPLMRYIIAPILPNAQDREDCLMETAMRVWEKIESFDAQREAGTHG